MQQDLQNLELNVILIYQDKGGNVMKKVPYISSEDM